MTLDSRIVELPMLCSVCLNVIGSYEEWLRELDSDRSQSITNGPYPKERNRITASENGKIRPSTAYSHSTSLR